jgi:hypothetical protein
MGKLMFAIHDVELATFCGRIGNLYGRYGLCPPFTLRDAAQGWIAKGIPPSHCIDVIKRYLDRHAGSCYSGSGDRNFSWLNQLIQTSWYERSWSTQARPAPKQSRHPDCGDNYAAGEPNQRPRHRAVITAGLPNLVSKTDSFKPDRLGLRQAAARTTSPARETACRQQIHQPQRSASRLAGQTLPPAPKKIDAAVAWLRTELAAGERAAAEVEANARCVGIATRTYDRARKRLGVTSRRVGFGRWAKYMIALPVVRGTPNQGANMAGGT